MAEPPPNCKHSSREDWLSSCKEPSEPTLGYKEYALSKRANVRHIDFKTRLMKCPLGDFDTNFHMGSLLLQPPIRNSHPSPCNPQFFSFLAEARTAISTTKTSMQSKCRAVRRRSLKFDKQTHYSRGKQTLVKTSNKRNVQFVQLTSSEILGSSFFLFAHINRLSSKLIGALLPLLLETAVSISTFVSLREAQILGEVAHKISLPIERLTSTHT